MQHWAHIHKAVTGGYRRKTEARWSFILHVSLAAALCRVPGALSIHTWPLANGPRPLEEKTDLEQQGRGHGNQVLT